MYALVALEEIEENDKESKDATKGSNRASILSNMVRMILETRQQSMGELEMVVVWEKGRVWVSYLRQIFSQWIKCLLTES